ncbi:MAG: alpha/beta hydrolase, partial [Rhodocyclaceae bacterium]|nr:alpha/beta hydrolase [Rhodocyclaceae bacterium]
EFAQRLMRDNPRLKAERAAFIAEHFSMRREDGRIIYAADPCHRMANPVLYRLDEAKACWRAITAPVLWVGARDSYIMKAFHGAGGANADDYAARLACFRDLREVVLEDCGHMMHHDQPARLAAIVEDFLAA